NRHGRELPAQDGLTRQSPVYDASHFLLPGCAWLPLPHNHPSPAFHNPLTPHQMPPVIHGTPPAQPAHGERPPCWHPCAATNLPPPCNSPDYLLPRAHSSLAAT